MKVADISSTVAELDAATHYRSADGVVGEIVFRRKDCPVCRGTTYLRTAAGLERTCSVPHSECIKKMLEI